ncbi:MAG: cryptochrome/photolyase family protein [Candidatus Chromulinivorax sp.]
MYKVFTPFFVHGCLAADAPRKPLHIPHTIDYVKELNEQKNDKYDFFRSVSSFHEKSDLGENWDISEKAALNALRTFMQNKLQGYAHDRDFPCMQAISRMSPYLASGVISPQQIWHAVTDFAKEHQVAKEDIQTYIKELCWREFCYNILYGFPELDTKNYRSNFDAFAWQHDVHALHAWQQGKTGYPLIDAGMRELLTTGFMHNRVRMVVASFLVKNLLIDWRYGKDWFWQQLVDADFANNSANWQWVAGCGADAAPYFRIFNPTLQAQKFDPDGLYIKKYVPELKMLPAKFIHEPWKAPASILGQAQVELGKNYPLRIVDTKTSAQKALALYKRL